MRILVLCTVVSLTWAGDVEADLRAAHAARATLSAEERVWSLEREGLQAALASLKHQADTDCQLAIAIRSETARLLIDQSAVAYQERFNTFQIAIAALHATLDSLRNRCLPGSVPTSDMTPASVLDAADLTIRASQRVSVGVENTTIDGTTRAVRVLRVGLYAGWWMHLDGSTAGTLTPKNGKLEAFALRGPQADAIRSAFAQMDGQEPTRWVMVPYGR